MAFEYDLHQPDTLLSRDIGKTDETGVTATLHEDELPEILIHGDEYSPFGVGPGQQHSIARIGATIPGLRDVVTLLTEPGRKPCTGTPINEKPHDVPTRTASNESWAMTACA